MSYPARPERESFFPYELKSVAKARAAREAAERRRQKKLDAATFKVYATDVYDGPVSEIPLAFGLTYAIPKGVPAAWGARMIFQHRGGIPDVGFVPDRNDIGGEPAAVEALRGWLHEVSPKILAAATLACRNYAISSSERGRFVIYEDTKGIVIGDTNASYGYLYCAGWLKEVE